MNRGNFKYTLLMTSLPCHPVSFLSAKLTPISRIQLDSRLALLDATDAASLEQIERTLFWSYLDAEDDITMISHFNEHVAAVEHDFGRFLVQHRLQLRLIVAALRWRRNEKQPGNFKLQGELLRTYQLIQRNWQHVDFGIAHLAPWITEANRLLDEQQNLALEKFILQTLWQNYTVWSDRHRFDFPAVILYVLRWDIISRWTGYDADMAVDAFNRAVEQSLPDLEKHGL